MYALFDIILRSQAIAKAAPMPAAGPLIEAITGFCISIMSLKKGLKPLSSASFDPFQLFDLSFKSAPAEKPLPTPVMITTLELESLLTLLVAL